MYQAAEASRLFINGPIRIIVKLSNSALLVSVSVSVVSVLVLVVAKLWKHAIIRRLHCAWYLLVMGLCAQFGLALVFVRLSSMAILAVHSPIHLLTHFSPPSVLSH